MKGLGGGFLSYEGVKYQLSLWLIPVFAAGVGVAPALAARSLQQGGRQPRQDGRQARYVLQRQQNSTQIQHLHLHRNLQQHLLPMRLHQHQQLRVPLGSDSLICSNYSEWDTVCAQPQEQLLYVATWTMPLTGWVLTHPNQNQCRLDQKQRLRRGMARRHILTSQWSKL